MSRPRMVEVVAATEAVKDLATGLYCELATDSPVELAGGGSAPFFCEEGEGGQQGQPC